MPSIEERLAALEAEVIALRERVTDMHTLAAHADRDVAEFRSEIRTPQATAVLRAMRADPCAARWGSDLARETGLKSGSLYPILARLESAGLVHSWWEEPEVHRGRGRPRRRYYRLTDDGVLACP